MKVFLLVLLYFTGVKSQNMESDEKCFVPATCSRSEGGQPHSTIEWRQIIDTNTKCPVQSSNHDAGFTGEFKGQKGEMGQPGSMGPKGEKGSMGQLGQNGAKGNMGETGLRGPKGDAGSNGIKGDNGEVAQPGLNGRNGMPGTAGVNGLMGLTGEKGSMGEHGQNGSKGAMGETGLQGPKGDAGSMGTQGNKGEVGQKGQKGDFSDLQAQLDALRKQFGVSLGIRLVNGSGINSGRVEILHEGVWGTICDDHWDINDGNVVCRMMGYTGATSAPMEAHFGQGTGQIWLDDVACVGSEDHISSCTKKPWGDHNCTHREDASVVCG